MGDAPDAQVGRQQYLLRVTVVTLVGAPKMDAVGENDAYVIMRLNGSQEFRTSVKVDATPVWNEEFQWRLSNLKGSQLQLTALDQDVLKDDVIGTVNINLKNIRVGEVVDDNYTLKAAKGDGEAGRLRLKILIEG